MLEHSYCTPRVYQGTRAGYAKLVLDFFLESEIAAYEAVLSHVREHGRCPAVETMTELGFRLQAAREPLDFYLNRVRQRTLYNYIGGALGPITEALASRDIDTALTGLRDILSHASRIGSAHDTAQMVELADTIVNQHQDRRLTQRMTGIATGYPTMDRLIDGYQPGDMVVWVGRPSVGKSYLLAQ